MFKFVGIVILLTASFASGFALSYQVKQRIDELLYVKKLMVMFRGELDYKNAVLPEAFQAVAIKAREPYNMLFSRLAESTEENYSMTMSGLFSESVDNVLKGRTYLKNEDLVKFKEIGETLGYQSQKMQIANIDLYIDRLSASIEEDREKMGETIKVYRTLTIMTGLLLGIVLL